MRYPNTWVSRERLAAIRSAILANPQSTITKLAAILGFSPVIIHRAIEVDPAIRTLAYLGKIAVSSQGKRPYWYDDAPDKSVIPVVSYQHPKRVRRIKKKSKTTSRNNRVVIDEVALLAALTGDMKGSTIYELAFKLGVPETALNRLFGDKKKPFYELAKTGHVALNLRGRKPKWFFDIRDHQNIPRRASKPVATMMLSDLVVSEDAPVAIKSRTEGLRGALGIMLSGRRIAPAKLRESIQTVSDAHTDTVGELMTLKSKVDDRDATIRDLTAKLLAADAKIVSLDNKWKRMLLLANETAEAA